MAEPQPPAPQQRQDEDPRDTLFALGLIMGVVMLGMTGLAWWSIADIEATGGGKLNILIAIPYRIGGKWFTLGGMLALAGALFGLAAYMYFSPGRGPKP